MDLRAEQLYDKAMDLMKEVEGISPANDGVVDSYPYLLGLVDRHRGDLYRETGRIDPAEQAYRQALGVELTLATDFPDVAHYRFELARTYGSLGSLLKSTDDTRRRCPRFRKSSG